jgi:hypothetical protein
MRGNNSELKYLCHRIKCREASPSTQDDCFPFRNINEASVPHKTHKL